MISSSPNPLGQHFDTKGNSAVYLSAGELLEIMEYLPRSCRPQDQQIHSKDLRLRLRFIFTEPLGRVLHLHDMKSWLSHLKVLWNVHSFRGERYVSLSWDMFPMLNVRHMHKLFHQPSKLGAEVLCLRTKRLTVQGEVRGVLLSSYISKKVFLDSAPQGPMQIDANSINQLHKQLRVSPNHSREQYHPKKSIQDLRKESQLQLLSFLNGESAGGPSEGIHHERVNLDEQIQRLWDPRWNWHKHALTENLLQRCKNHQASLESLKKLQVYFARYHQFMENPHRFRSPLDDSLEENVVWHTLESERCTSWIPSLHPRSKGLRTMKRLWDVWTSLGFGFFIYWKLKDSAWPGIWSFDGIWGNKQCND